MLSDKILKGVPLSEWELKQLVWGWPDIREPMEIVETIRGREERKSRKVQTILNVDGKLYALDWVECSPFGGEDIFKTQPYRVRKRTKLVRVNEYIRI